MFSTNFISTVASGEPAFDPDALAFFNRVTAAGGTLTALEKEATNQLVEDFKGFGIWTLMKAIYPMVGASSQACAQNLSSSDYTGTFTAGWTFASTGITPNGTSAYMDTGLIPINDLLLDSAHLSVYIRGTNLGNQIYIGGRGTVDGRLTYVLNFGFIAINNGDQGTTVDRGTGLYTNSRIASNRLLRIKNGILQNDLAISSTGRSDRSLYVGGYNNSGGLIFPSNNENAFATIGDGLTETQAGNFYTAVQAFQTTLSRQV